MCLSFESAVVIFRPSSHTADADWPCEPSSLARSTVSCWEAGCRRKFRSAFGFVLINAHVGSLVEAAGYGVFLFPQSAALPPGWKTMRVRLLEPLEND